MIDIENLGKAIVADAARGERLVAETLGAFVRYRATECLDREAVGEDGVPRFVQHTHAARTQHADDFVFSEK